MCGTPFHYDSCGLPNIRLKNGFTIKESNYGEVVSIHNLEGLHRAIGLGLVNNKPTLSCDEVRFLRKEMDLPQVQLAALLGVSESTVRNWEKDRAEVPGPADRMLRTLYLEFVNEGSTRVSQLNRDQHELGCLEFSEMDGEWLVAA